MTVCVTRYNFISCLCQIFLFNCHLQCPNKAFLNLSWFEIKCTLFHCFLCPVLKKMPATDCLKWMKKPFENSSNHIFVLNFLYILWSWTLQEPVTLRKKFGFSGWGKKQTSFDRPWQFFQVKGPWQCLT